MESACGPSQSSASSKTASRNEPETCEHIAVVVARRLIRLGAQPTIHESASQGAHIGGVGASTFGGLATYAADTRSLGRKLTRRWGTERRGRGEGPPCPPTMLWLSTHSRRACGHTIAQYSSPSRAPYQHTRSVLHYQQRSSGTSIP
eukprot:1434405-Rhodomonas_salina.1